MLLPVNRCQSPTSTASPNAVNVEIPRRHCNRPTIGAHCASVAISVMALSRRSRRVCARSTVSNEVSKAMVRPTWWKVCVRSRASWAPVHAVPPGPHDDVAQQQLRRPVSGPHQLTADVLPGPDQVPGGLLREAGHRDRDDPAARHHGVRAHIQIHARTR